MRDGIVIELARQRPQRGAHLRGARDACFQGLIVRPAKGQLLLLLPEPAAEQVIFSCICEITAPFYAAPAPLNTITPTRDWEEDVP